MKKLFIAVSLFLALTASGQVTYDLDQKKPITIESLQKNATKTSETAKYKGEILPVFKSKKGKLFIIAKSKKGNFYRKYLKK